MTNSTNTTGHDPYALGLAVWNHLFAKHRASLGVQTVQVPVLRLGDDGFVVETGEIKSVEIERFDHSWISAVTQQEFDEATGIVLAQQAAANPT